MRLHARVPVAVTAVAVALGAVVCDPYGANDGAGSNPLADGGADGLVVGDTGTGADVDEVDGESALPTPVEIAVAQPRAMAASSAAMIWLQDDSVYAHVPNGSQGLVMKAFNNAPASGFLALESSTAVMDQAGGVSRCTTQPPCNNNVSAPIYGLEDAGPLGVLDGEIYVAERGGSRRLMTCGIAQSCGTNAPSLALLPAVATRMALGSTYVVLALEDKSLIAYPRAARLDAGVTAPVTLASVFDLRGLAVDGKEAYWTDGAAGTIARCAVDACASTTVVIAGQRAFPRAIAVAAGTAYWVETDGDSVWRCSVPACTDVSRVARVMRPVDLAIGDRVYVASAGTQKIYAVPR